ncbi:MAG TPA: ornithine cyclodeaminase family protein [Conexibacter sp.]|jgi:ornithine cyclodeaminase/alanine dehydrogenase
MTLFLDGEDVRALATHDATMSAARAAVDAERAGRTALPARLDVDLPKGFLRVMPAALDELMGLKVMTLVRGLGTRYVILLYSQDDGALLAVLDADEVTRMRTAATTVVAGEMLAPGGASTLALLGTGFEAEGHLIAFARAWRPERVLVYSRDRDRREAFAARQSEQLGIAVTPAESMEAAISAAPVSILATKATEPVVDGTQFPAGGVVLSIGSTRPDLRELDGATLQRAAMLLVDDAKQVKLESGDVIDGLERGLIAEPQIVGMAEATAGAGLRRNGERDLLVFKSVGTALQDLALSRVLVEQARAAGRGRELGELTALKAFAASRAAATPAASATTAGAA